MIIRSDRERTRKAIQSPPADNYFVTAKTGEIMNIKQWLIENTTTSRKPYASGSLLNKLNIENAHLFAETRPCIVVGDDALDEGFLVLTKYDKNNLVDKVGLTVQQIGGSLQLGDDGIIAFNMDAKHKPMYVALPNSKAFKVADAGYPVVWTTAETLDGILFDDPEMVVIDGQSLFKDIQVNDLSAKDIRQILDDAKKLEIENNIAHQQTEVKESDNHAFFRCLGYDHDVFHIFQYEKSQLCEMKKGDFTEGGLLALAPRDWWNAYFPAKTGFDRTAAVDWLFRQCYKAGVFRADSVRGRGAWLDEGRSVYHFGSHLFVDGKPVDVCNMKSEYIYEVSKKFKVDTTSILTVADGQKILNTAKMFRWVRPASAPLLCGWLMLSRLCGALKWRPHIWITGESGSGKSTIVDKFVHTLVSNQSVFAQGNSTEAGIRQKLRSDALPVLFDESEQNNEREQNRVQNVLSLIRQASSQSGAQTLKGTVTGTSMQFDVRSMFMLSSIQVSMLMQADRERITVFGLQPKKQSNAADQWKVLEQNLIDIGLDETMGDRLFMRGLTMLPQILKNIDVFRIAAARYFGTVREGDQYGTMLAGCWSLCEDALATEEDARNMIEKLDWSDYTAEAEDNESKKALAAILERKVRSSAGELTIYEIINTAKNGIDTVQGLELSKNDAEALLGRHGMRLDDDGLLISNNSNAITDLLRGSQYQADWRGQITRVDGITKHKKSVRINGIVSRCLHATFETLGV